MWVDSEYANELAVLSAWIAVLVPWNIASHSVFLETPIGDGEADVLFLRFPFVEFQFRDSQIIPDTAPEAGPVAGVEISDDLAEMYPGVELFADLFVTSPPQSALFYDSTLQQASILWTVASIGFALAFALSIALYVREDQVVAALPVSSVKLMGALLGVGALGTAGASVLQYAARDTAGFPIPVGVLVVGLLSVVLLSTEEVEHDTETDKSE